MHTLLHIAMGPSFYGKAVEECLRRLRGWRYLGMVCDSAAAAERCQSSPVTVVLVDLARPDSFELLGGMRQLSHPAPRVVVNFDRLRDWDIFHIEHSCCAGVVANSLPGMEKLPQMLCDVAEGGHYFSSEWRSALRDFHCKPDAFYKLLGRRQIELLPLLGRGLSNDTIADAVHISPFTVQNHRHQIMSKIGLKDRSALVRWCFAIGAVGCREEFGCVGQGYKIDANVHRTPLHYVGARRM